MTIASAFNDIAVAQGGTAAKRGAITAAIDALNDALAGSDQPQAKTIEQAVRLLGEHIGGGGDGGTEYSIKCYEFGEDDQLVQTEDIYALGVWDAEQHDWKPSGSIVTKASAGDVLVRYTDGLGVLSVLLSEPSMDGMIYPHDTRGGKSFVMPAHDVCAAIAK